MESIFNLRNEEYTRHFVTILTCKRIKYFGRIENGMMNYSNEGRIAAEVLNSTGLKSHDIKIDQFVIMPEHIHVIVLIKSDPFKQNLNPLVMKKGEIFKLNRLDGIIRTYKATVTKLVNNSGGNIKWHRGYHHRVIATSQEYENTKSYIINNPKNY
ncbi:MAG: hypothetical protein ACKOXF_12000 [Chitinophagaceae bacterium]